MTTNSYTTRFIIRVDSHVSGEVDLSEDVVRFQSNKQIKGRGRFQFDLVPRKNYLNWIYPNDVVNVYVDIGDGKSGFVRLMFGYIDRINRTETTDATTGAVSTRFTVICSDFQKAIDQTHLYFNPHLQTYIDVRFRNSLLGQGSTLRTNGIVAFGTPADFVENILLVLAGFGQQWVLPKSYPPVSAKYSRTLRTSRALKRLPSKLVDDLKQLGLVSGATTINEFTKNLDKYLKAAQAALDVTAKTKKALDDPTVLTLYEAEQKSKVAARLLDNELVFRVFNQALTLSESTEPPGIVDLMEFGFIEHLAVDGFSANLSVWQSQGSLSQLLYGRSNPIVNELMFDLRPVSAGGRLIDDGGYSRDPDETGINKYGIGNGKFKANVDAVQYVPSVIMREYPFSTVEGYDLSNYYVFDDDAAGVGFVQFGPIFSKNANSTVSDVERVTYDYRTVRNSQNAGPLAPEECLFSKESKPIKHLDVAKIRNTDIVSMNVGRDDNDVMNLFALYSTSGDTKMWKFHLRDISPILNPISIARNGLRVQEPTTEFGNYSRDPECSSRGSAVDNAQIRRNLVRWQLLMDHWHQHNIEYLSGTVELRGMPWIRAGYRVDLVDRNESYYVEQVSHTWECPKEMRTSLQLSRGQRNDPFPAYIPPAVPQRYTKAVEVDLSSFGKSETQKVVLSKFEATEGFSSAQDGGDRGDTGRLSEYFRVKDTEGTLYAVMGSPTDDVENKIDKWPNADGFGRAEYAGDAPSTPSAGRFGNVPKQEDENDVFKNESNRLKNEARKKNRAAAVEARAARRKVTRRKK